MREAALQKRRKAAEELLQWHQKLLDEERKITELEMAASNIINQVPSLTVDNSSSAQNTYKFLGSQLNVLWENMTGLSEKQFKDAETYNLSQVALERFCKDAKKHSSKKNAGGECNTSQSSMTEIMHNISSITDEISELYKLSSVKNEGDEVSKSAVRLSGTRMLRSESVKNNRQLSLNKDSSNDGSRLKDSQRDLNRKQSSNTDSEASRQILSATQEYQQIIKEPRVSSEFELEKRVPDESRQEAKELKKNATVGHQKTEELKKSVTDKSQKSRKNSKELEEHSTDHRGRQTEELKKDAKDQRLESQEKSVELERSATVKSLEGRQSEKSASDKRQESRRKIEEHQHTSESISSLDNELSVISKDCIPNLKSDPKSSNLEKVSKSSSVISEGEKHNVEIVSISSSGISLSGIHNVENISKSSSVTSEGVKHSLENASKSGSVISLGRRHHLENASKSSSVISVGGKHKTESVSKSKSVNSLGGKHNQENVSKSSSVISEGGKHSLETDKSETPEIIEDEALSEKNTEEPKILFEESSNKKSSELNEEENISWNKNEEDKTSASEEIVSTDRKTPSDDRKQSSNTNEIVSLFSDHKHKPPSVELISVESNLSKVPELKPASSRMLLQDLVAQENGSILQIFDASLEEELHSNNPEENTQVSENDFIFESQTHEDLQESSEKLVKSWLKSNEASLASDKQLSGSVLKSTEEFVASSDNASENLVGSNSEKVLNKDLVTSIPSEDSSALKIKSSLKANEDSSRDEITTKSSLNGVSEIEQIISNSSLLVGTNEESESSFERKEESIDKIASDSVLQTKDHLSDEIPSNSVFEINDHSSREILSNSVLETQADLILSNSVFETKEEHSSNEIPSNTVFKTKEDHSIYEIPSISVLKTNDNSSDEIPSNSVLKTKEDNSSDEIPSNLLLKTNADHSNDEIVSISGLKTKEEHASDEIPSNSVLKTKDHSKEITENDEIISKSSARASRDGKVSSGVSLELKPLGRNRNLEKDAKNSHNTSVKRSSVVTKANDDQVESDDSSRITDHLGEIEEGEDVQSSLKTNEDKGISLHVESREENEDEFEESKEDGELEEANLIMSDENTNKEVASIEEKSLDENEASLNSDSKFENPDETSLISSKDEKNVGEESSIPDEIEDNAESLDYKQLEIYKQRELSRKAVHEDNFNSTIKTKDFEELVQNKLSSLDDVEFLDFNASMKEIVTPGEIDVDKNTNVEEFVDDVDKNIKVEEFVDKEDKNIKVEEFVDKEDKNIEVEESVDYVDVEESVDVMDRNVKVEESVDVSSRDANSSISSEIENSEEAISSDDLIPIIEVTIEGRKDVLSSSSSSEKDEDSELEEGEISEKSKPHISVKQRVSEIMADAHINTSIGDKSPRLQDLYVTTYDVITPEGSPELGSPVESKSVSPKDIYGNEAEELLRKQLAIEQEIKQLEQQQQLPYLFMREIPNKPPPPYTPPVQTAPVLPPTVLPMTVEQISSMTPKISQILFEAHRQNTLTDTALPEDLPLDDIDRDCWEFLFDLCKEYASGHYEQFEEVSTVSWMQSPNLRLGFKRELEQSNLKDYLDRRLRRVFEFEKEETKESMIIKWSRKKRDHVDELLVVESQAEEVVWTNYNQDESIVRNEVTNDILKMLLDETAEVFKKIVAKRN